MSLHTSRCLRARLPTGETVLRQLTKAELAASELKETLLHRQHLWPQIGPQHLFRVWRVCQDEYDYRVGLWALNLYYNLGRPHDHPQTADRLIAMRSHSLHSLTTSMNLWRCCEPSTPS
ncbi:unnamed protein product [Vitrella brassicaformis CCMP3155]|uniref:Uncharacterized protein n=1 Tax=Vitrella brassicaformis (strain CCMP3155) TaxID=1169540 RepID=A0A0G4EQM6_VITBC|nr:unnamed protein product [Vitrella brassicaformis CCMP3155]|eukprot:CEL99767.1 unnamed protein product [Vitrella brassicaformis CCMP3155]